MINGHIDLSWLDEREYYLTNFVEITNTVYASGYWADEGLPVPDYPLESTTIHQTFDEYAPGWAIKIKDSFDWLDLKMVTVNCVKPGRMIPPHKDAFFRIKQTAQETKYNLENKIPIRVNLFLQDFRLGHFLQIEDNVYSHYKRGDYTFIRQGQLHTVSNTSNHNRYTLQVTGFMDKNSNHNAVFDNETFDK